MKCGIITSWLVLWGVCTAAGQTAFVNWENAPLHSVELTPDGTRLLVANLADGRLEVFDATTPALRLLGSVGVGIDPVSVRTRTSGEAWVVNHISDSVSIVDLATMRVVNTLRTADEPYDVVFAGDPPRAFVSCSQANLVQVFDPSNLAAAPLSVAIDGEDPRSLAVSPDGGTVYAAIFESGNRTTILGGGADSAPVLSFPPNVVSDPLGPYGGVNPPPNDGALFNPPIAAGNNPAPPVGLIVRKNANGRWMDDNGGDWTDLVSGDDAALSGRPVGWDLPDHDLAMIDADSLAVTYATGLMNICMAAAVNPATGQIAVIGSEATNEIRFEPVLRGRFVRVHLALVDAGTTAASAIVDLNPHLDYSTSSIPALQRALSIGDPRGIVWTADGSRAYVSGMGSNNVIVIDAAGQRAGGTDLIAVGEGPVGLALDEPRGRLYVHNRFSGSISTVNTSSHAVIAETPYYDPTPEAIRVGRKHLYDTHLNSGLGQIACASCHVDANIDRLAWDLGNPEGGFDALGANNLGFGLPGLEPTTTSPPFAPFHPMKGPMTTQTFRASVGLEPLHWRGDRTGLEPFANAFEGLQGTDEPKDATGMQEFESFLATVTIPPNPFRNFDNSLPTNLPLPGHFRTGRFGNAGQMLPAGNAQAGMNLYRDTTRRIDRGALACVTCHTLPTGAGPDMRFNGAAYVPIAPGPNGERHVALVSVDGSSNVSVKIPHLRNLYEKVGFDTTQNENRSGFGLLHDGSVDSIARFVSEPAFSVQSDQEVANLVAFMLAFSGSDLPAGAANNPLRPPGPPSRDTHAAVGWQTTVQDGGNIPAAQSTLIGNMLAQANLNRVGLVAKSRQDGVARGYSYEGASNWQSDRAAEVVSHAALLASAAAGSELTITVVPFGSQVRIGIDRDSDTFLDRDELDACSDPADAAIVPGGPGSGLPGDLDGGGSVNLTDLAVLLSHFGQPSGARPEEGDIDEDADVDLSDLAALLTNFGAVCPQ